MLSAQVVPERAHPVTQGETERVGLGSNFASVRCFLVWGAGDIPHLRGGGRVTEGGQYFRSSAVVGEQSAGNPYWSVGH